MKSKIRLKGKLSVYLSLPLFLTIPLALADVGLYYYNVAAGAVLSGFIVIYFAIALGLYSYSKPQLTNEVINFATQYATVQKRLLNEFEIPYALLDYSGKILWVNQQFMELTGVDSMYHKAIVTLFPMLTREFLQKSGEPKSIQLEKNDRVFRISLNRIYFDSVTGQNQSLEVEAAQEYLTALYLFDETELTACRKLNLDQKQVSALVYIDNYDEVIKSIEDVKRSLLIALVDRKVNQYFAKSDALVRKIEKDKYFVVFKYKYLQELMEDRFSVLEDVKTVRVGNEMTVTLSIGVGIRGDSYNDGYDHARAAIDLALGRGGDQVVVKEEDELLVFADLIGGSPLTTTANVLAEEGLLSRTTMIGGMNLPLVVSAIVSKDSVDSKALVDMLVPEAREAMREFTVEVSQGEDDI